MQLLDFITALEDALGIKANRTCYPMQPGRCAFDAGHKIDLFDAVGYKPLVDISTGVTQFWTGIASSITNNFVQ